MGDIDHLPGQIDLEDLLKEQEQRRKEMPDTPNTSTKASWRLAGALQRSRFDGVQIGMNGKHVRIGLSAHCVKWAEAREGDPVMVLLGEGENLGTVRLLFLEEDHPQALMLRQESRRSKALVLRLAPQDFPKLPLPIKEGRNMADFTVVLPNQLPQIAKCGLDVKVPLQDPKKGFHQEGWMPAKGTRIHHKAGLAAVPAEDAPSSAHYPFAPGGQKAT